MGLDLKPLVTPVPIKLSELADKVVAIDAVQYDISVPQHYKGALQENCSRTAKVK